MAEGVAEAFVTLRPDTKGFGQEAKRGIGGAFGPIGKAAAAGMAVVGAAIVGTAVAGVKAFASFERGMNEVFTLMPGISGEAMDAMSDQVLQFSKDFGTLPEEVVPALYQALSAGVPQDNVFTFLEVAQKAAIAGVTELETAVDGISSVVNAYGADVLDAAEASDIMFTAVRLGKTDFTQLSQALFNVIPTAASLGVEFGDVAAALATITAQGTPTTVATTQLRQLFVELSKDGGEVAKTFSDISGKSFREFIAEGGNVQDALQALERHAEDSNISISDLFGSVEAGNAALGLTGQGTDAFAAALEEMGTSAGATEAAYTQMDQGMSRAMDKLKAGWEVLKIHIGEELQPAVQAFADWVVENMPMIEEKVTTFFQGVGLVAEAVAQAFFGAKVDIVDHLGGVDGALDSSTIAVRDFEEGVKVSTDNSMGAFQTIADFITDDLQPAFEGFKEWWNNGGGEAAFKAIGWVFGFIADQISDTVGELQALWRAAERTLEFLAPIGRAFGGMGRVFQHSVDQHHEGGIFGEGGTQRNFATTPMRGNEGFALLEHGEEILPVGHPRHARSGKHGAQGGGNHTFNIYNPAPADPGESVARALERLTLLGV